MVKKEKKKELNYIDLFAGAGGLSEGFLQNGFFPIAHVEYNSDACDTLITRMAYYHLRKIKKMDVYNSYLKKEIARSDLLSYLPKEDIQRVLCEKIDKLNNQNIFGKIDKLISNKEVDIIVGGPPCQAYSLVGRAVSSDSMQSDERNNLYIDYLEFVKRYKPKMFVFENVPGILTAKKGTIISDIKKRIKELGYNMQYKKISATDFGVLQNRNRIIIIGWKENLNIDYPEFSKTDISKFTISQLLCDLPPINGDNKNNNTYVENPNSYLLKGAIRNENDILSCHVTRRINEQDSEIYEIAIKKWLENNERLSYGDLPRRLKTHKNENCFLDRFKVVAPNLNSCQTMIAHISKDGHYFIHPDIKQIRSISVREAARIQSFPDNYFFEGSRTSQFIQIGNAVPVLMAHEIAKQIKIQLMR